MRPSPMRSEEPPLLDQTTDTRPEPKACDSIFIPTIGSEEELAKVAFLSSLADPTARGKLLGRVALQKTPPALFPKNAKLIHKQGNQDICGIDFRDGSFRVGGLDSVEEWVHGVGGYFHNQVGSIVRQVLRSGRMAFVVANEKMDLGVIAFKMKP